MPQLPPRPPFSPLSRREALVPQPCTTITLEQSITQAYDTFDSVALQRFHEAYNIRLRCLAPSCHSRMSIWEGPLVTSIVFTQMIAADPTSVNPSNILEQYNYETGCRAPTCFSSLSIIVGSIQLRVVLALPDTANASTVAAVHASATAFAARPAADQSSRLKQTVLSTSAVNVSRVASTNVRIVLAIPNGLAPCGSNSSATSAAVTAAATTLAAQPEAVLSNATVVWTSQVTVGCAIVPIVVAAYPPSTVHPVQLGGISLATEVVAPTLVLVCMALVTVGCACACRHQQESITMRRELLAEAKQRRASRRDINHECLSQRSGKGPAEVEMLGLPGTPDEWVEGGARGGDFSAAPAPQLTSHEMAEQHSGRKSDATHGQDKSRCLTSAGPSVTAAEMDEDAEDAAIRAWAAQQRKRRSTITLQKWDARLPSVKSGPPSVKGDPSTQYM